MTGVDPDSEPSGIASDGAETRTPLTPFRAGEPAPPGTFDGRARAFRENETKRRSRRRERIGQLLVVAVILLGIFAIVTARPFSPSTGNGQPPPGPPIVVTFTTPVVGQVTCGNGETAYTERTVWNSSSPTVTTGDVALRVYELIDGDIVNDRGVVPNANASSVCAGSPPEATVFGWYVVVSAPNDTIELTYAFSPGWASVTQGPSNVPIENGTIMTVVMGTSLAGRGYGFAVTGFASGSQVSGAVAL